MQYIQYLCRLLALLCLPLNVTYFSSTSIAADGTGGSSDEITQSGQPSTGPGGASYQHSGIHIGDGGAGAEKFYIFEPYFPQAEKVPVVVLFHGYDGMNPDAYGHWITHLVKRGNTVIFPVYQDSLSKPETYSANALNALIEAFHQLRTGFYARPDEGKVVFAGHSLGAAVAIDIAKALGAPTPTTMDVPAPLAIFSANGADADVAVDSFQKIVPHDLSTIAPHTLILSVVGHADNLAKDKLANDILTSTPQIPRENKEIVTIFSDVHGTPALIARHSAAISPHDITVPGETSDTQSADEDQLPPDMLDFYGYWKLLDGLTDAVFYGVNKEFAMGNTAQQKSLGIWSDGTLVHEARVSNVINPLVVTKRTLSIRAGSRKALRINFKKAINQSAANLARVQITAGALPLAISSGGRSIRAVPANKQKWSAGTAIEVKISGSFESSVAADFDGNYDGYSSANGNDFNYSLVVLPRQ